MNLRNFGYHIRESFPAARLCLCFAVIAFAAVASAFQYIDIAGTAAISFTCYETAYLILNDTINLIYIFLPLYVFLVCGIMFDNHFGAVEIIKCGSRAGWMVNKYLTFVFYTMLYFVSLTVIVIAVCANVFPAGMKWSRDFVNLRVLLGQSALDFAYSPLATIGLCLTGNFFFYLMTGSVSMLLSLIWNKEHVSLFAALIFGICGGLLWERFMQGRSAADYLVYSTGFLAGSAVLFYSCLAVSGKRDFPSDKVR